MRQEETRRRVVVIGGGIAGSEAALRLASNGIDVDLFEMRPHVSTPAHKTQQLAELVCSNSLGSDSPHSASRILKDELHTLGSHLLQIARENSVPAGASLAVDREKFSSAVTSRILNSREINLHRRELPDIPEDTVVIIATGPLTSKTLNLSLPKLTGKPLYFYDAISPIVSTDSLDQNKMFAASRYGKGGNDFLNIPLSKETYFSFIEDLTSGEVVLPYDFEEEKYFEGCLPIETMAQRGPLTLAFGPMKPVGLWNRNSPSRPFAIIQLRKENIHGTAYNMVGFQTKLKYGEQMRIFRKLPGLENAEFLRLGSMHRNTYINSPSCLCPTLQLRSNTYVFVAGQLTGTEGYLESCATGLLAGWNAARFMKGLEPTHLPTDTMLGALMSAICDPTKKNFQPMNVNFGLLPPLPTKPKDKVERNRLFSERSQRALQNFNENVSGIFLSDQTQKAHCTLPPRLDS